MITWAQNFEDVILWRALRNVKRGFYVDVGANHPEIHSTTKIFYDSGWSGINIEPVSELYELLQKERVRDVNLNLAASSQEGEVEFYEVPNSGLSSMERNIAEAGSAALNTTLKNYKIKAQTLDEVLYKYGWGDIHFLKIDVEGHEDSVMAGLDLSLFRPWILLVEATVPLRAEVAKNSWEEKILSSKYQRVYFDGLNYFYLAEEHSGLINNFSKPPNVFDDFYFALSAKNKATLLHDELINSLQLELKEKTTRQIAEIQASISWKITAPLRKLAKPLATLSKSPLILKNKWIRLFAGFLLRNEPTRRALKWLAERIPLIDKAAKNIFS